jgi:hypothetical protein
MYLTVFTCWSILLYLLFTSMFWHYARGQLVLLAFKFGMDKAVGRTKRAAHLSSTRFCRQEAMSGVTFMGW